MKRGMMPAHPGEIIKETIEGLKEETGHRFTLQEIAQGMDISRKTLSKILNGHQGISPEMSVRLSEAFGTSAKILDRYTKKLRFMARRTYRQTTIVTSILAIS